MAGAQIRGEVPVEKLSVALDLGSRVGGIVRVAARVECIVHTQPHSELVECQMRSFGGEAERCAHICRAVGPRCELRYTCLLEVSRRLPQIGVDGREVVEELVSVTGDNPRVPPHWAKHPADTKSAPYAKKERHPNQLRLPLLGLARKLFVTPVDSGARCFRAMMHVRVPRLHVLVKGTHARRRAFNTPGNEEKNSFERLFEIV
mmetsp:Transcript_4467/g.8150  ORF Transcript_4467/g.8150 Transcript_4467/m.8150 type:complete len:204 (+) Transcript_4467:592-1203(+)